MTKMGRALDTTLFVKNGPCMASLGLGGEGYLSFSIATPTGEGVTTPLTFTRERRCSLIDDLHILGRRLEPASHAQGESSRIGHVDDQASVTRWTADAGRAAVRTDGTTPDGDPLIAVDTCCGAGRGDQVVITSDGRRPA